MDFNFIRPVLSGLIGFALVEWLRRRTTRQPAPVTLEGIVLRHPTSLRVFSYLSFLVFCFFTIFNALGGNVVNSYAVAVSVPFILTLASAYGAVAARVSVVLGEHSLRYYSPWGTTRDISWTNVTHASYAPALGYFRLHTRDQGTIAVSTMLIGIAALPALLDEHAIPIR